MRIDTERTKRIVIKVGTSTLTHETGFINIRKIERLAKCLSDLQNSGKQIILVSSGAVACGLAKVGFDRKSMTTRQKQAAAAIGQCDLIDIYSRRFAYHGHTVAQILITKDVIDDKERCENAKSTLKTLIDMNVIPVVNENDTISSEQISIGSNDTLAAVVAVLTGADLLINLSDIDGLYTKNPRTNSDARFVEYVKTVTPEIEAYAGGAGSERGTGGMFAKIESAKICTKSGVPMIILNGKDPDILYSVFDGDFVGTYFDAVTE